MRKKAAKPAAEATPAADGIPAVEAAETAEIATGSIGSPTAAEPASAEADDQAAAAAKPKRRRKKAASSTAKEETAKKAAGTRTRTRAKAASAKTEDETTEADAKVTDADAEKGSSPKRKRSRSSSRKPRTSTAKRIRPAAVRKEMVISVAVGEQRVAVIEDDSVVEVYLERRGRSSVAGNIYKGVVDNVLPGMEASFVDIGLARNGFLYVGEIIVPEGEQGSDRKRRRIQDLIARGQEVLVQAVKDPMGTKGARLTTEISLPGRFVVFVPHGEGIGISRRLEDEERERLKKLCRKLDLPEGGIIVRTAAEGATEEELRGDLALLRKLWATIVGRSNRAEAPTLVYREAELPLRLVRDLFIRDFERMVVDHEPTHRRLVGYLKRTSPELAARIELDAAAESILQRHGVEEAMRSTLSRNVPLPSGGSLVFDYAEALTVIDVNTGRFTGSKGSQNSLEDTITKNNLEAAREVVRQLRLRDIGGIIVIDFIDMSNAKNRKAVEKELELELARDRTKTHVVEISPLGLVEMTRQNVTDGPRETLTVKCPTCSGDGVVVSEETMVIDVERALRSRARATDVEAMLVELNERTARHVIGPGGDRLADFEADVGKRVFVESRTDVPLDYVEILAEGTAAEMELRGLPVSPGEEIELKLEGAYLLDDADAIARLDGYVIVVGAAGRRVGETVEVVVDRVTRTAAYASLLAAPEADASSQTLTAEAAIGVDGSTGELDDVELAESLSLTGDETVEDDAAEADSSSADEESETTRPAAKRRRRRRKSSKASAEADADGTDSRASVTSEDADPSQVADATSENGASDASEEGDEGETPKKPARRRRRRGGSRSKSGQAQTATDNGASAVAPPDDGAGSANAEGRDEGTPTDVSGDASEGSDSLDAQRPKRRRRRSSRSRKPAAGASSNGEANPPTSSDVETASQSGPNTDEKPSGSTSSARRRRRRSSARRTGESSAAAEAGEPVASSQTPAESGH